jgi:hypothetical protein
MDIQEANKKVHNVEDQWHYPIMIKYGFKPEDKTKTGLVRNYKYKNEKNQEVIAVTGANGDYFKVNGQSKGYWSDLEPYLKELTKENKIITKITKEKVEEIVDWLKQNEESFYNKGKDFYVKEVVLKFKLKEDLAQSLVNSFFSSSNADNVYESLLINYYKMEQDMENSTISISAFTSSPKELIGREIQYGEKTAKVTKVTNSGFVTFDNGDTYDWDDLLMIDALLIGLNEVEEEEIDFANTFCYESLFTNLDKLISEKYKFERYDIGETEGIAFMPLEDDVTIFLIKKGSDVGINFSWGGFDIIDEQDELKNKIDSELTSKVDFGNQSYEESVRNIISVVKDKVEEQAKELSEEPVEKPIENKMDQFIFMYYVVKNKSKILSGHQYKEDANEEYADRKEVGENLIEVMSRREIDKLGLDLSDNSIWETDFHDWNIIEEAVNFGVTEGDYTQESANNYIEGFKSNGNYSHVIKARLIYFLSHAQKHLKQAFLNSQIEKASSFIEKCTSSEMELMRMLKSE